MTELKDEEVESEEALEALATLHDLPLGCIASVIFILLCLVSGVLKKTHHDTDFTMCAIALFSP